MRKLTFMLKIASFLVNQMCMSLLTKNFNIGAVSDMRVLQCFLLGSCCYFPRCGGRPWDTAWT